MASISEGFPFAIIEAMLSGATIVSTDVGGVREAIADTGLMVRAGRPEQMAEAYSNCYYSHQKSDRNTASEL